ncbi:TerD family protein [Streptomyces yunnanensis]|uniref:TerD family protein n=1 Tax=Streptomyces yunnanensis TaxID=156453 RepID=A0ABY8AF65_9ACTN|nr:TerD family protein [Streptomyces yunnanensis]WEB43598.1 TerD family protein [Streptomyces yunnanensis]
MNDSLPQDSARLPDEAATGLTAVTVGLGWNGADAPAPDWDLDLSALLCDESGKVLSDRHFVFYNNLRSPDGSVWHTGDSINGGDGGGDDEQILVCLSTVPAEVARIVFPVSIHEAEKREQCFGQVRDAFVRVTNQEDRREVARCNLSEDASAQTAVLFGEVYRDGPEWKFRALGREYASGLFGIAKDFGVNL